MTPQPRQRRVAAEHYRVRDLRVHDVVIDEGRVMSVSPSEGCDDRFLVQWDRANYHTVQLLGSQVVLVAVDLA